MICAGFAFATPVLDRVSARQRFPWNNLVDIDYTLSGMPDQPENSGYYLRFGIADKTSGRVICPDIPLEEVPPVSNGTFRVTWNPARTKGLFDRNFSSGNLVCNASLFKSEDDPHRYLTIDLSGGADAENYPVSYSPVLPNGGLDDLYKTTRLIMRKIDHGTFDMGLQGTHPENDVVGFYAMARHRVTLTRDYYIGIFEVTRRQWNLIMGKVEEGPLVPDAMGTLPAHNITYSRLRADGSSPEKGSGWELSEGWGWPSNNLVHANSFIGKLRQKTGLDWLDLPTEAQWEYAARAGTTNALNSGVDYKEIDVKGHGLQAAIPELNELARYEWDRFDRKSEFGPNPMFAKVGSYRPNRWGLYDCHGNVWEWCLDIYNNNGEYRDGTDPKGATYAPQYPKNKWYKGGNRLRVVRGGGIAGVKGSGVVHKNGQLSAYLWHYRCYDISVRMPQFADNDKFSWGAPQDCLPDTGVRLSGTPPLRDRGK